MNHQSLNEILTTVALQAVWAMSFPLVGAVIATHRPRNPLGWMFLFIGLSEGLIILGYEYATYVFLTAPGAAPGGELATWVSQSAWAPALGLALCYVPLLFPDGRLPSRRWRPVAWLSAIPITVITVLTAVVAWPWRGPALLDPDGIPQDTSAFDAVFFPAYILMLGCGLACLTALVLRFRRARRVERQQLKWLMFACALTITIVLVVQPGTSSQWDLGLLLAVPFFPALPVAAGSLLFVLVAGAGADPPSWLVAAGTLAAAAVFRPVRGRIQAVVDRRFNRRRYHAAKTIEAFSTRLRDEIDLDTLSAELVAVVHQTMEPTHISCWLRPSPHRSSGTARDEAWPAP